MSHPIPSIVKQYLQNTVTASVNTEVKAFALYDNHPKYDMKLDVVICTKNGKIMEFHHKREVLSFQIDGFCDPLTVINLVRSKNGILFYLVRNAYELVILCRNEAGIQIHKRICDIENVELDTSQYFGQGFIKILKKDDAVPIILDDELNCLEELTGVLSLEDTLSVVTGVKRKLAETSYNTKYNEKIYKDVKELRHLSAYCVYKKVNPNNKDSSFKPTSEELANALNLCIKIPWIKVYNDKLVIVIEIVNENKETLKEVQVLLHNAKHLSMTYTTKVYKPSVYGMSPFWEDTSNCIAPGCEHSVIAILDMNEIRPYRTCPLEFKGVIVYKKKLEECVYPIHIVNISPQQCMMENLNLLADDSLDSALISLVIIATSIKTELTLRNIKENESEPNLLLRHTLIQDYHMVNLHGSNCIYLHKGSPYHLLNGLMVVVDPKCKDSNSNHRYVITVYSRSPSQLLDFIYSISDIVQHKILTTTSDQIITAKEIQYDMYTEKPSDYLTTDKMECLCNQSVLIKEYLDKCILKMSESLNAAVQAKIGCEIDLKLPGADCFERFSKDVIAEGDRCITLLMQDEKGTIN